MHHNFKRASEITKSGASLIIGCGYGLRRTSCIVNHLMIITCIPQTCSTPIPFPLSPIGISHMIIKRIWIKGYDYKMAIYIFENSVIVETGSKLNLKFPITIR